MTEQPEQQTFEMVAPADMHVHLRDGAMLERVAPFTARQFDTALVMPNLVPPVTTRGHAILYRERIKRAVRKNRYFKTLMTCYLTDNVDAAEVIRGFKEDVFAAVKLYPAGATTNSDQGLTSFDLLLDPKAAPCKLLEKMQKVGMPLCIHGEMVKLKGVEVDPFDREKVFIINVMQKLRVTFPELPIILEHVSTNTAVYYVCSQDANYIAATITPHHLMVDRRDLFRDGFRPHLYCLPPVKRASDRRAVIGAATSGDTRFFCGTDSAPHFASRKHSECCPGGIFNAPAALECYAQVFWEELGVLDGRFENFMSLSGPNFYKREPSKRVVTFKRDPWKLSRKITVDEESIWPFLYEKNPPDRKVLEWKLVI